MILLLIVSLLIILLCFTPKEGFYSDNNTYTAISSLNQLKKKIETTKKNFIEIKNNTVNFNTSEIVSKLQPILKTNKDSLYTKGVVENVENIIGKLAELQKDFDFINNSFKDIDDINKKFMDVYIEKIEHITELLSHIPDDK